MKRRVDELEFELEFGECEIAQWRGIERSRRVILFECNRMELRRSEMLDMRSPLKEF